MSEFRPNFKPAFTFPRSDRRPDVEFFDPPMCCPTGLCGPTLDQTLLDLSETILALQKEGYQVERYQMTTHPQAFINQPDVMRLVREKQLAVLPIVIVRGQLISEGRYPGLAEIQEHLDGGQSYGS
jgi:hypothetical protein